MALVFGLLLAREACAQIGVPTAEVAVPTTAGAAAAAPAAPPKTIWSFLGLSGRKKGQCRLKLCRSPIGQLLNNLLRPASAMTGGIIPSLCPPVPPVASTPGAAPDAGSAAAAVAADQKAAKERRAAVKFLANVDCQYWPEAEAALVSALRADKNECVRWEAANSLASGCCCTPKVREALAIAAEGSDRDGNPPEKSWRVRQTAAQALARCAVFEPAVPASARPERPVRPESPSPAAVAARRTGSTVVLSTTPVEPGELLDLAIVPAGAANTGVRPVSHTEAVPAARTGHPNPVQRRQASDQTARSRPRNQQRGVIPMLFDSFRPKP